MSNCTRNAWISAGLAGLVVWTMALTQGGAGASGGLFLGFVTAWLVGGLIGFLFSDVKGDQMAETVPVAAPKAEPAERTVSVSIARPQRPVGMERAPQGASRDPRAAATFEPGEVSGTSTDQAQPHPNAERATTDASRLRAARLAKGGETADLGQAQGVPA